MANFNEWLSRRDEAFHQDRFNRAMDKMRATDLVKGYEEIKFALKNLEDMIGQVTRLQGPKDADKVNGALHAAATADLTDKGEIAKAVQDLIKITSFIREAPKGMPNRELTNVVANLQNKIDGIRSRLSKAKFELGDEYQDRHGSYGDSSALSDFYRATEFKRSGNFGPSKYKPHTTNFEVPDDIPSVRP